MRVLHQPCGVGHVGAEQLAIVAVLVADLVVVQGLAAVQLRDDAVLVREHEAQQRLERLGLHEVDHADAHAARLVGERGAGACAGGADRVLATHLLVELVDGEVPRHDDVGAVADAYARGVDAALVEHREFVEQRAWVDDDAVPDDARRGGVEDAGGHEVQPEAPEVIDDRVPGIAAGRVAGDYGATTRQEVDDAALAFVAPLPADDDGCRHGSSSNSVRRWIAGLAGRRTNTPRIGAGAARGVGYMIPQTSRMDGA